MISLSGNYKKTIAETIKVQYSVSPKFSKTSVAIIIAIQ